MSKHYLNMCGHSYFHITTTTVVVVVVKVLVALSSCCCIVCFYFLSILTIFVHFTPKFPHLTFYKHSSSSSSKPSPIHPPTLQLCRISLSLSLFIITIHLAHHHHHHYHHRYIEQSWFQDDYYYFTWLLLVVVVIIMWLSEN